MNEIDDRFIPENEIESRIYEEFTSTKEKLNGYTIKSIKNLPENELLNINGKSILCTHGSDRSNIESIGMMTSKEELIRIFDRINCDILLCGHTHEPFVLMWHDRLIMNVGSVGAYNDKFETYGILDIKDNYLQYCIRKVRI